MDLVGRRSAESVRQTRERRQNPDIAYFVSQSEDSKPLRWELIHPSTHNKVPASHRGARGDPASMPLCWDRPRKGTNLGTSHLDDHRGPRVRIMSTRVSLSIGIATTDAADKVRRLRSKMDDDEEVVCPLPKMKKDCEPKCASTFAHYLACVDRITAKGSGDCEPYYFDYLKCIDKCVRFSLFYKTISQAMPHIMSKLK